MMRSGWAAFAVLAMAAVCQAQLTPDQKQFDFRSLANIYAKRYGPYDWKRSTYGFDLLDVNPWLDRVTATANDLDFYELMIEYVSGLHDTHDAYLLPSSFTATLGISADLYDGKVIIDGVNRNLLPAARFPFTTGDEILSVDGRPISELIDAFSRYAMQGNPRSTKRRAIERILTRPQSRMPHAHEIGDSASLVIQRRDGPLETYTVPWNKNGLPLTTIGPVAPRFLSTAPSLQRLPNGEVDYMEPLRELQHSADPDLGGVLGHGALAPVIAMPEGFEQRLGKTTSDYFYSGVFTANEHKIGFVRIPSYDPGNTTAAVAQFQTEIAWMQENTEGLIVDQMRNPGGLLCYGESIASLLIPTNFTPVGFEIRATWEYMQLFYSGLQSAKAANAPAFIVDQFQMMFDKVQQAYNSDRGRTEPVTVCTIGFDRPPARDSKGSIAAYQKPLIMLIDEFSTSTADMVPAILQDNKRGLLVGYRTNGAGGSNSLTTQRWQVGTWSEGDTGVTLSLMVRKNPVSTPDFPEARYIENVGVRPDIELDIMTMDNLLTRGKPFFDAVTSAIVGQIEAAKQ